MALFRRGPGLITLQMMAIGIPLSPSQRWPQPWQRRREPLKQTCPFGFPSHLIKPMCARSNGPQALASP